MDAKEQKRLLKDILHNIERDMIGKIDTGKIPENWDGIELREYIADQAKWHKMEKRRAKAYRNTVLVNGL